MASACVICGEEGISRKREIKDHSISGEVFTLATCQTCGFEFTSDAPDVNTIGPYYIDDDYISHSDKKSSIFDHLYHLARRFMLAKKVRLINRLKPDKGQLLDIGSGTGYFIHQARTNGWSVRGVEVSESAKVLCRDKFGIEAMDNDAIHQLPDSSIDIITLWHVLEHVHDLNGYWKQFQRMLNASGYLVIAVPNIQSTDAGIYGSYWAAIDVPRHLWHFRPEDIVRLAEKHQFVLKDMKGMPLDAYYVSMLSERYLGRPFGVFRGLMNGLRANIFSDVTHKSSIIYILQKKP